VSFQNARVPVLSSSPLFVRPHRRALYLLLAFACVAACHAASAAAGVQRRSVTVTDGSCARGWVGPSAGRTIFTVRDVAAHDSFFVQLVDAVGVPASPTQVTREGAAYGRVFGQLSLVAPGTEVPLDAVLPPGRYFFRCLDSNGNTYSSRVEHVGGVVSGAVLSYKPVTANQLAFAMQAYRDEIGPILARLGVDTDRLAAAVRGGKLAAARALWLPAHLDYARLGVAYGTFGELDTEIDGRPFGLEDGVRDSQFRGFLRLEYGLWHGQPTAELVPIAAGLDRAVHALLRETASPAAMVWANTDLPLRAHEILENTLRFELTGGTNEGSGTNLATAWANAEGTMLALDALAPLLRTRDTVLLSASLSQAARLAAAFKAYDGPRGWRPVASLTTLERERLESAIGALLETLERVPEELRVEPSAPSTGD
jgi:high-affinity iron transporter